MGILSSVIAFLLILPSSIVHSQIEITAQDILNRIGKTQLYESRSGPLSIDVGSSGANQVWDFENISGVNEFSYQIDYVDPKDTPFSDDFPEATLCEKIGPSSYCYFLVDDSSYRLLGEVVVLEDTTVITHVPPQEGIPLPLTMGTRWTYSSVDTLQDHVRKSLDISEVDAWGTMRLLMGDIECLRQRLESVTIREYMSDGMVTSTDTSRAILAYNWLSKSAFLTVSARPSNQTYDPDFDVAGSVVRLMSQSVTSVGGSRPESPVTINFELLPNYPNPFNAETNINFVMQMGARIELTVHNLLGERVATLIDDHLPAGEYKIKWRSKSLPSGIYFARLQGTGLVATRKLLLQK